MLYRLAILSCIVLLLSQMTWRYFSNPLIYTYTDGLFKCGILYALSRLAKKESKYYFLILDFFFQLSIVDYIIDIFYNPYKIYYSQYHIFICLLILFIIRLLCFFTKKRIKKLIKLIFSSEKC